MPDFIRREKFLGGEKIIVGDKRTDLILESLGKVYIKSGNSSRSLNEVISAIDKLSSEDIKATTILGEGQTINNIEYPGDGKLIYDGVNSILYITVDKQYIPLVDKSESGNYVNKSGDTMTGQLIIDLKEESLPPLIVSSKELVSNLNAEYINGEKLENYTKRNKDESIEGTWKFNNASINNLSSGTITSSNGYSSGLSGYGWSIDSDTLTIDNIVVRKTIQIQQKVEEIFTSRVNGESSNTWCNMSFKIESVKTLEEEELSKKEITTNLGVRNIYFSSTDGQELISGYDVSGIEIEGDKLDINSTTNGIYNFYDYFQGTFVQLTYDSTIFVPKINEIYRCQSTNKENVQYYDIIITNITDGNDITARLSQTVNDVYLQEGEKKKNILSKNMYEEDSEPEINPDEEITYNTVGEPKVGDSIILIGNISSGQTGVYLSSLDYDSPCIKVIENSTTPDYEVQNTINTKIGKLFNINDIELNPSGVGVYTKNIFAKTGKWLIGNGVIKYSDNGVSLNELGKLEVSSSSISPFGNNVESYIKNSINSELVTKISQLESLITQLNTRIQDLESRVEALETATP